MDLDKVKEYQRKFAEERDWDQFHSPKNLSMALSAEVGELVEILQWLKQEESNNLNERKKKLIAEELSDILYYVIRLSDKLDIDLESAFWDKAKLNEKKYPIEFSKGNAKKYSEFDLDS